MVEYLYDRTFFAEAEERAGFVGIVARCFIGIQPRSGRLLI